MLHQEMCGRLWQLAGHERRMTMRYNAEHGPNRASWFSLDQEERIALVLAHHRQLRASHPPVPDPHMHAVLHMVVENQVALGAQTPVEKTLMRLMDEGLSRHDAVHAIGSVFVEHLVNTVGSWGHRDADAKYFSQFEELTAEHWRQRV